MYMDQNRCSKCRSPKRNGSKVEVVVDHYEVRRLKIDLEPSFFLELSLRSIGFGAISKESQFY